MTSVDDRQPRVLIVGGPDVDARIELMQALGREFCMAAAGSSSSIAGRFLYQFGITAAAAVMALPFENFTPGRSLNVYVLPSFDFV